MTQEEMIIFEQQWFQEVCPEPRVTREQIERQVRDHLAYGWTARPGSCTLTYGWNKDDCRTYMELYFKLGGK